LPLHSGGWNDAWLDPRFRNFSILERLSDITVPVLLLQGTQDRYGTLHQLELIEDRSPQTTRTLIEGADHAPHLSHISQVLDALDNYITTQLGVPRTPEEAR
jgi:pimeloyl-ACP methyl ester carboxylesterase